MRYAGHIYRPPSEADSLILQATIGCSWNACTYCEMYRDKKFSVRPLDEVLTDIGMAANTYGPTVRRIFIADGDALMMETEHWEAILTACHAAFPKLKRISAYATAQNLLAKSVEELKRLRALGLRLLYIGPESGDAITLKRIAKGSSFADHVAAAQCAHEAGMQLSTIFLLGVGGAERSAQHATESAKLITAMNPTYLSLLTLMVLPGSTIARQQERDTFAIPTVEGMLQELRTIVAEANPTDAVFRTNHASNYLPLSGRLPRDRQRLLATLDSALSGNLAMRSEEQRGL